MGTIKHYSLARNLQMVYQGFQIFCSVDPSQNFQARKEPLENRDITKISSTVITQLTQRTKHEKTATI